MKINIIKTLFRKFLKFFDTTPEIFDEDLLEILPDKQEARQIMNAIENTHSRIQNKLPTKYTARKIGIK